MKRYDVSMPIRAFITIHVTAESNADALRRALDVVEQRLVALSDEDFTVSWEATVIPESDEEKLK